MTDTQSLIDQVVADDEKLAKQVRIEGDRIIIDVQYEYEIPISVCDTAPRLLGWVQQLLEKTWITPDVVNRFIHVAAKQSAIEIIR